MHHDFNSLKAASDELEALRHYAGLYDIRNGAGDTADEFHLDILPKRSLWPDRYALGMQVRTRFTAPRRSGCSAVSTKSR